VGSCTGSWGVFTWQFVEHPVRRSCYSLLMFLGSTSLFENEIMLKRLTIFSAKIYINNK
jgi:hypothetical protein